jgi:hypothetical protein
LREALKSVTRNQGVKSFFLTEIHHHKYPKQFLAKNLLFFREALGVETLFFEFLSYDRHQRLLDAYFESPADKLPSELYAYLKEKDAISENRCNGYVEIVKAAKRAGIRIVALDSYESLLSFGELSNLVDKDSRVKTFNYNAFEVIKQESHGKGFLVYTGLAHAYATQYSLYPAVKSIAQLWPSACVIHLSDDDVKFTNCRFFDCKTPPFFNPNGKELFESNSKLFGADIVNIKRIKI